MNTACLDPVLKPSYRFPLFRLHRIACQQIPCRYFGRKPI